MDDFSHILDNRILLVSLGSCLLAQAIKLVVELARQRKFDVRTLVTTGGMPSAHSALVSALATGIGQTVGWSSIEFAMATIFAIIVMYDAAGVRRAAGKQAAVLNQIIDEFFEGDHQLSEERLKELLGHTPFQVIVGCGLGIACSLLLVPSIAIVR